MSKQSVDILQKPELVLVAEQMSVEALKGFAESETTLGKPTFFHDYRAGAEPAKAALEQSGVHYVYKPQLTSAEIEKECSGGAYTGLMVRPKAVSPDVNVKIAVRVGTGTDNLTEWAKKDGRIMMNTPGQNASATAEYAFKGILTLLRKPLDKVPASYDAITNRAESTIETLFHALAPTKFHEASQRTAEGSLTSKDLTDYLSTEVRGKKIVVDMEGVGPDLGFKIVAMAQALRAEVAVVGGGNAVRVKAGASYVSNQNAKDAINAADAVVRSAARNIVVQAGGKTHEVSEQPKELLAGKSVAVIGIGDIGTEVARMLVASGGEVRGSSPSLKAEEAAILKIQASASVEDAMRGAHAVTLHMPGGKETDNMIGTKELGAMQNGAAVINAARASVINMDALGSALASGKVTGFIVDADRFPGEQRDKLQPYLDHMQAYAGNKDYQLLVTPHFGGDVTKETNDLASLQGAKQINEAIYNRVIYNAKSSIPAGYKDGGVVKPEGIGKPVAKSAIAPAAIQAQINARQGQLIQI